MFLNCSRLTCEVMYLDDNLFLIAHFIDFKIFIKDLYANSNEQIS